MSLNSTWPTPIVRWRRRRRPGSSFRSASTVVSTAAHEAVTSGAIGSVQLMRSLTRDPGLANPAAVPPWTIFLLTLIHDFDILLWLNPGADPVEVYATADALVAPDFKNAGLLDTAVVVITFDNGARAVAEANFSAAYGYDVRGEVWLRGHGDRRRRSAQQRAVFTSSGWCTDTVRSDIELMRDAYTGEFVEFAAAIRECRKPSVTGVDARRALAVALACIASVQTHAPSSIRPARRWRDGVPARRLLGDGVHRLAALGTDPPDRRTRLRRRDLGLDQQDIDALVATGATFSSMTGYIRGNLTDPDGADELLATAEQSIPVAARLGIPRLNLHGTGLGESGSR